MFLASGVVTRMSPSSVSLGSAGPSASIDREGTVSGWDAALDALWGRSAAQAVGLRIDQLLVALEPSTLPDLGSLHATGVWTGIVALLPANGNAPRTAGIRLSLGEASDSIELQLAPLSALAAEAPTGDAPVEAARDLQRFAAMLEFLPGYCYTVDRELTFTSSGGKGLEALNLRPGQVIGMNLRTLWGTRDDTYEPLLCHLKALAGISARYNDFCLGRSLEYLIRPLCDAAGDVVGAIGVGVDVTEIEHARQAQAKLTEQLQQAQKLEVLGRLTGGIAHDFNNFLTCIMGNLSLLEHHVARDSDAEVLLAQANTALDSAAALTRQLLAFSRKQVVSPRPTDLGSLMSRLSNILKRLAGHRIGVHTESDPGLWRINVDPGQIEQVLLNLVLNARDAIADEGQILVQARNQDLTTAGAALPEPLRPGHYVELSVTDSGRGVSDVVRARLFEPFFTTKDAGEGTGLGLATVHAAVKQCGGAITVESELGKGATFRILLPRIDVPAEPEVASIFGARAARNALPGGTETILLVEDEPLVLELGRRTLQQLGYNVLPCLGPDEALRVFGEYQLRIELLVTDLVMPRMNGNELAARIRALSPGVPVLFSTGHGESIMTQQGIVDDGQHFISKPYRAPELATKVRSLLDQRRARAALS
jgi:signal transduction histidine kinase/ActR/RegA family two-component response regulator